MDSQLSQEYLRVIEFKEFDLDILYLLECRIFLNRGISFFYILTTFRPLYVSDFFKCLAIICFVIRNTRLSVDFIWTTFWPLYSPAFCMSCMSLYMLCYTDQYVHHGFYIRNISTVVPSGLLRVFPWRCWKVIHTDSVDETDKRHNVW